MTRAFSMPMSAARTPPSTPPGSSVPPMMKAGVPWMSSADARRELASMACAISGASMSFSSFGTSSPTSLASAWTVGSSMTSDSMSARWKAAYLPCLSAAKAARAA